MNSFSEAKSRAKIVTVSVLQSVLCYFSDMFSLLCIISSILQIDQPLRVCRVDEIAERILESSRQISSLPLFSIFRIFELERVTNVFRGE